MDGQENKEIHFKEPCLPHGCTSDLKSYYKLFLHGSRSSDWRINVPISRSR